MMNAQMLSLASGCTSMAASAAAPAVVAESHADVSNPGGASTSSAAAAQAHPLFSSLMRGLSAKQSQGVAKRSDANATAADHDAAATSAKKTAEQATADAGDAAKPAAEAGSDLPGMAMPLLPTAVDLSLNAALQAANAAQATNAAQAANAQAATSGAVSQAAAANVTMDAGAASGMPWPASPGEDDRGVKRPAAGRAAAAVDAAAGLPTDGSAPTAGSRAAALRFADGDDSGADSGDARKVAVAMTTASNGSGDRGSAARGDALAAASTGALPDSASLPSQNSTLPAVTVKLADGSPAQWRQALTDALGDRLQVQVSRNIEQAVIRLDPPNLGRIDISISQTAGNLQVHLSASNTDVLRQLHEVGATLRQDLSQRQQGEVAVTVADTQSRGGDSRQRSRQTTPDDDRSPGKALAEAEAGYTSAAYGSYRERD